MKLKTTLKNKIICAAVIALCGAWLSLLICTILGTDGAVKQFLPLWLFLIFGVLDAALAILPYTAARKWLRPAALAGAALVILVILRV